MNSWTAFSSMMPMISERRASSQTLQKSFQKRSGIVKVRKTCSRSSGSNVKPHSGHIFRCGGQAVGTLGGRLLLVQHQSLGLKMSCFLKLPSGCSTSTVTDMPCCKEMIWLGFADTNGPRLLRSINAHDQTHPLPLRQLAHGNRGAEISQQLLRGLRYFCVFFDLHLRSEVALKASSSYRPFGPKPNSTRRLSASERFGRSGVFLPFINRLQKFGGYSQ